LIVFFVDLNERLRGFQAEEGTPAEAGPAEGGAIGPPAHTATACAAPSSTPPSI
jgi:hypothetical protein